MAITTAMCDIWIQNGAQIMCAIGTVKKAHMPIYFCSKDIHKIPIEIFLLGKKHKITKILKILA